MRSTQAQQYLDIYANNENITILLLMKDDKIHGRALLWQNVNSPKIEGNFTLMDVPFVLDYNSESLFKKYAEDNNWAYMNGNSCGNLSNINYLSKTYSQVKMYVPIENFEFKLYPHIDTFELYSIENKSLVNCADNKGKYYRFISINGIKQDKTV